MVKSTKPKTTPTLPIIPALWISARKFCYHCPFCLKKHCHNHDAEFHDRLEHRVTHCAAREMHHISVSITSNTPRRKDPRDGAVANALLDFIQT